jgi:hypothetical protein
MLFGEVKSHQVTKTFGFNKLNTIRIITQKSIIVHDKSTLAILRVKTNLKIKKNFSQII